MKVELGEMNVVVATGVVRLFWGDLSRTLSRTLSRRDERTEKSEEGGSVTETNPQDTVLVNGF